MTVQEGKHIPVLLKEILDAFDPKNSKLFLDCTFGGGGHTRAILQAGPNVRVIAIDKDPHAILRAQELRETFGERFSFYDMSFGDLDSIPETDFAGILMDLGVSSFQLDQPERGFSFRHQADADMRLNPREGESAAEFLETASNDDLVRAVRDYGEEKSWKRVVQKIKDARGTGQLQNTQQLAALIETAVGRPKGKPSRIHPATKTFQGIRMAVNDELGEIERALPVAFDKLAIGGLLAVISFHSLEDRIIKRFFRRMAGKPESKMDSRPQDMRAQYAKLLSSRPIVATEDEISKNPRSRSAKLRILKKERGTN